MTTNTHADHSAAFTALRAPSPSLGPYARGGERYKPHPGKGHDGHYDMRIIFTALDLLDYARERGVPIPLGYAYEINHEIHAWVQGADVASAFQLYDVDSDEAFHRKLCDMEDQDQRVQTSGGRIELTIRMRRQ